MMFYLFIVSLLQPLGGRREVEPIRNARQEAYNMRKAAMDNEQNQDAAKALKVMLKSGKGDLDFLVMKNFCERIA